MLTTSDRIKKQIKNVEHAERALDGEVRELVALQEMLSEEIKEKHPLNSFVGKEYVRFRTKWGFFNEDHIKEQLDPESIESFNHLEPHSIKNGEELNSFVDSFIFDENKNYVIYVEYYYDYCDDFNEFKKELDITPFDKREIYEYLIFEI